MRRIFGSALLAFCAGVTPAIAASITGGSDTDRDEVPNILIARVPAVKSAEDLRDQRTDTDVDVFALKVKFVLKADGTVDTENLREQVINLMATTTPVKVKVGTPDAIAADLSDEVKAGFQQAEADSVAAYDGDGHEEAYVAWRGWGPVRGYRAGVVAFNSSVYRGYYPYYYRESLVYGHNPYFGYYANGHNYPFTYGIYRSSPSYHYFGYYRRY